MPWFKVDDKFHANVKVTRIPRSKRWSAIGLWTIAGVWSADQLTDGFIPQHQFEELGASTTDAEQLVFAQLWSEVTGGYQFNNWSKYQPSAVEVTQKLERLAQVRSEAGKKGAHARWNSPDGKMANDLGSQIPPASNHGMAVAIPDPTRPDPPTPDPKNASNQSGQRITADFEINREMRQWFEEQALSPLDINVATQTFIDYYLGQEGARGIKADWIATWRNWMRRAKDYLPHNADLDPWAGKTYITFDDVPRLGSANGPVIDDVRS